MSDTRVLLHQPPFAGAPRWAARWIADRQDPDPTPRVLWYRLRVVLDRPQRLRLHISADERYRLSLDGVELGCGPERGDRTNWFYESHDLDLTAGPHQLLVTAWWLGERAPLAQHSLRHALLVAAEGEEAERFDTGRAPWECRRQEGWDWLPFGWAWGGGAKARLDAGRLAWEAPQEESGWCPAVAVADAWAAAQSDGNLAPGWILRPALLPAMLARPFPGIRVRLVAVVGNEALATVPLLAAEDLPAEAWPGRPCSMAARPWWCRPISAGGSSWMPTTTSAPTSSSPAGAAGAA